MIFILINLIFSFFIFLFCLHLFSKDDFVLLRKNVTLEQIFNYAFLGMLISLFFARVFYVLFHPALQYLNPLIFLIFIYFPGLSLTGSVVGMCVFLFFLSQKKKIPRGRVYDIFSLAFLPALVSNIILQQLFNEIITKKFSFILLLLACVFLVFFIVFSLLFQKDKAKDGSISILTMIIFSLAFLVEGIIAAPDKKSLLFNKDVIILVLLFLTNIILFMKQKLRRRGR